MYERLTKTHLLNERLTGSALFELLLLLALDEEGEHVVGLHLSPNEDL
jgi:hypothetical protein